MNRERIVISTFFLIILTAFTVGGFYYGRDYEKWYGPAKLISIPPCPTVVCPKIECPEECVYNDRMGYKFIKWEKNGMWCVGVKPYGSPDIKWYWCGKEK